MPKAGEVQIKKQGKQVVVSVTVDPEQIQTGVDEQGNPVMADEDLETKLPSVCSAAAQAIRRQIMQDAEAARADEVIAEANAAKAKGRLAIKP